MKRYLHFWMNLPRGNQTFSHIFFMLFFCVFFFPVSELFFSFLNFPLPRSLQGNLTDSCSLPTLRNSLVGAAGRTWLLLLFTAMVHSNLKIKTPYLNYTGSKCRLWGKTWSCAYILCNVMMNYREKPSWKTPPLFKCRKLTAKIQLQ